MTRKSYRKKFFRKAKKYTRRARKYTRRYSRKGGNGNDKVNCCMCGKEIKISEGLVPQVCLNKNGLRAHRICEDCWWDKDTGFAREGTKHDCPGCEKDLPLTKVSEKPKTTEIIDLTEE